MQPQPPGPPDDDLHRVQAGVQRIGRAMLAASPPGWIRLDLLARVSVDYQELVLHSARPDGTVGQIPISAELQAAVLDLRRGMYAPSIGAWLSARITADPPMQLQLNLNYNDDPLWTTPPPAQAYHHDLRAYPRPPELVLDWLRERLALV